MGDYIVRKSTSDDVTCVMELINAGKDYFAKNDIPQWNSGYPNEKVIEQDILDGCSYVLCESEKIIATTVIAFSVDENYNKIYDGNWLSEKKYAAIHRIAVDPSSKKSGLASRLITYAAALCKELGVNSLRVDTHEKNEPMRAMLIKNGFVKCGIIFLNNSINEPRLAYEKQI